MWFGEKVLGMERDQVPLRFRRVALSVAPLAFSAPSISPVSFLYICSLLYFHRHIRPILLQIPYTKHPSAYLPAYPSDSAFRIPHLRRYQPNHNESTSTPRCQPGGHHRYIGCPYPGSLDIQWRVCMETEDGQGAHRRGCGIQQ